jgi:Na+-translocating ferredoxin:NAD+ oxidoreductase RnfG subunit
MTSGALNWRSLASLVLIAGFCGTALVWVNAITAPRIETQRQEQARALMNSLLQPEQRIELKALDGWRGDTLSACTDWWLLRLSENGYAGPIEFLAYWQAFDGDLPSVIKLRVLNHLETPGIGDFIDHERSDYLPDRDNWTRTEWQTADTLSGATITHNALKRAAESVAQYMDGDARTQFCRELLSDTKDSVQ